MHIPQAQAVTNKRPIFNLQKPAVLNRTLIYLTYNLLLYANKAKQVMYLQPIIWSKSAIKVPMGNILPINSSVLTCCLKA